MTRDFLAAGVCGRDKSLPSPPPALSHSIHLSVPLLPPIERRLVID